MKKVFTVIGVLIALLFVSVTTALAYNNWRTSQAFVYGPYVRILCVWDVSQIGNGPYGGGAAAGHGEALIKNSYSNCDINADKAWGQPAGWVILDVVGWKQNGSGWTQCFDSGWQSNGDGSATVSYSGYQGIWNPPCGAGTYQVVATTYVWDLSYGVWRGGGISSPNYYLPSTNAPLKRGSVPTHKAPVAKPPLLPPTGQ
jgi:hypothetical protein